MTETKEKMTALNSSAATDNGQSPSLKLDISIPDEQPKINENFEDDHLQEYFRQMNSPDYLHTVSLSELYDTAYQPKAQIIDGILCSGVYLFAGAPKVGKSFFMAQLGYHVSGGVPLWEYPTHKGTVLYLALEDDYTRLQKRLSKMFGMDTPAPMDCSALRMERLLCRRKNARTIRLCWILLGVTNRISDSIFCLTVSVVFGT